MSEQSTIHYERTSPQIAKIPGAGSRTSWGCSVPAAADPAPRPAGSPALPSIRIVCWL
ncbi:hypothetical protein PV729_44855 [Streptomyces europaeiscabiei]|uniref:Uncharacterized protein n=1 Tax=Streptomyces europaeiscabiei TaxID=146819 RepID=A0ABU4NU90_9ACTN|nr:hypothetical protein [Streptomyces europaeiscabiei]MDX2766587.1 hypothetical protein [Streptomyces europaeiscabiei]MDX2772302.1 hypothetical protein [Streptomyces europaeiscabiei]MDX3548260.1 hypothetical protein [Streptomyces europaeiscabiei]MDX3558708.1 hypothetical protein [Streptomyces europaeiscabiei]MDX3705762.1 hypothetical protein [Streptomyces europaeiscabiei]